MKMKVKKLSIMLVCVMLAAFLGGCGGSYDAAGYISAILDNSYKNDSTQFVSMKIGTAEKAAELYEEALEKEADNLINIAALGEVTEPQREQMKEIMKSIYEKTKYTVDSAEKQDDGSYEVSITYEQINVFAPAIGVFIEKVQEMEEELSNAAEKPSQDELRTQVFDAYIDSFRTVLENVTYDEQATAVVKVELNNQVWQPNLSDYIAFQTELFDIAELNELLE